MTDLTILSITIALALCAALVAAVVSGESLVGRVKRGVAVLAVIAIILYLALPWAIL